MAKLPKVHRTKTGRYVRIRVRHPKRFKAGSIRTHDIGRKGHSKRLAGRLKKNNRWATQSFLVLKTEPQHVPEFRQKAAAIIRRELKAKKSQRWKRKQVTDLRAKARRRRYAQVGV